MERMDITGFRNVIVTEGMTDGATGRRIYGVFGSEEDAASPNADALAIAIVSEADLTTEQIEVARRNSEPL